MKIETSEIFNICSECSDIYPENIINTSNIKIKKTCGVCKVKKLCTPVKDFKRI